MREKPDSADINDWSPSAWATDLVAALGFLTRIRLPMAYSAWRPGRIYRAFPLIGLLIGGAGALVFWLATLAGLSPLLCGLLAVLAQVLLTGALHEDGLADTADGLGAGAGDAMTRERRLEIMRDSRSGAFGVLALVFSIALRVAALAALAEPWLVAAALLAAAAAGRAAFSPVVVLLSPARADGLGRGGGTPDRATVALALAFGVVPALLLPPPWAGVLALALAAVAVAVLAFIAKRRIGGYTGDVLGAAAQVTEITILLTLAAILGS